MDPLFPSHPRLTPPELDCLLGSGLFSQLSERTGQALLRNARVVRLRRRRTTRSTAVDLAGSLCGVASGAGRLNRELSSGRRLSVTYVQAGCWVAGASGSGGDPGYEIESLEDLTLVVVERRELAALCASYPDLPLAVLDVQAVLLRRIGEMLEELHELPVSARVERHLRELSSRFGVPSGSTIRIPVRVSQQDMAEFTGMSRQRVNHELRKFARDGTLRVCHGRLEFASAAA